MKEKLEILCSKYNLTASSLAKALGVEASAISHIRSGRNKPSYDFVVKILRAFPDVNPDWLLLDGDEFLRTGASAESTITPLFPEFGASADAPSVERRENIEMSQSFAEPKNVTTDKKLFSKIGGKEAKRVIVLYTDGSFESYDAGE
ncbi:MAG: helix-turn-helix transcriptional regulator [Alistipes sp.]|nr:helix-turn-helix transcriptional regulator [Alistipes sp.]